MESFIDFKLNPIQLTYVENSSRLWNQKAIILKIKEFIANVNSNIYENIDIEKEKWVKIIIEQIEVDENIEKHYKSATIFTAKLFGNRLTSWLKIILTKLNGSNGAYPTLKNYIDNTKWNLETGFIDEIETFKSIYNGNINSNEKINIDYLFEEACNYCLVELIHDIWNKYSEEEKISLSMKLQLKLHQQKYTHINLINYWQWYLTNIAPSFNKNLNVLYRVYDIDGTFEDKKKMMFYCIKIGNDIAFKYFFNQLSSPVQNKLLLTIGFWVFIKRNIPLLTNNTYFKYRFINIFLFVWERMTKYMKMVCLKRHRIQIIKTLLSEWPSQILYHKIMSIEFR